MSENLQGPACTWAEYEAAQKAGMLIMTTSKEREIHAFAELIREEQQARIAGLHADLAATRKQLAEAQADNAEMHSAAHRLALEAECFYMDCKDMALVSKWDDPLQTAISDVQAIRWIGDTCAISAAIAEAVEPYKLDADRYQQLRRGQHWSVINGIGEDLRADELDAAIDALAAKEAL